MIRRLLTLTFVSEISFLYQDIVVFILLLIFTVSVDIIVRYFKNKAFHNKQKSLIVYCIKRWPFSVWILVVALISAFYDRIYLYIGIEVEDGAFGTLLYYFWTFLGFPLWLTGKIFGWGITPFFAIYKVLASFVIAIGLDIILHNYMNLMKKRKLYNNRE